MTEATRANLGSLMSLTCFHYLREVAEETAGRALVVSAGRKRGYDLAEGLGLLGDSQDPAVLRARLDAALGADGTRLCVVRTVSAKDNGG